MTEVSMNKNMKLSEHFTLGEVTKTSYKTEDQNIPSRVAIENLKNLCENWLEDLRYSYYTLSHKRDSPHCEMLIINSGYRSPEVNSLAGGSPTTNRRYAMPRYSLISLKERSAISMSSILSAIRQAVIGSTSP